MWLRRVSIAPKDLPCSFPVFDQVPAFAFVLRKPVSAQLILSETPASVLARRIHPHPLGERERVLADAMFVERRDAREVQTTRAALIPVAFHLRGSRVLKGEVGIGIAERRRAGCVPL